MNALEKVRSLHNDLATDARAPKAGFKPAEAWALAERLLSRMTPDAAGIKAACAARDLVALDALIARLETPQQAPRPSGPAIPQEELDKALRAFRKRIRVMRLADESKLGGRYTSGGRTSNIDAIIPPSEFPAEVWKALEAQGKLRHTGQGFYLDLDPPASE